MGGLSDILFGEKPKSKVTEKSLQTSQQEELFKSFIPYLENYTLQRMASGNTLPDQKDIKLNALPTSAAPSVSTGLPTVPGSSLQNTSLSALEGRANKIASGDAFSEQLGALSELTNLFREQQAAIPGATEALTGALNAGGQPINYKDPTNQIMELMGASPTMTPEMQTAMSKMLSGQRQDFNQYFQESVQDPMLRDFQEKILPSIGRKYTGNFYGSERATADERATEDLLQSLTESRSTLAYNTDKDALARMMEGLTAGQQDLSRQSADRKQVGDIALTAGSQGQAGQTQAGQLALGSKQLEEQSKQSARGTSLDAITSNVNVQNQTLTELSQALAASGVPFEQSNQLAQTLLAQQTAGGQLGLQAGAQNLQAATTTNDQTIQRFSQLLEAFKSGTAADQQQIALLLQALLTPTKENIATTTGGSSGLLSGMGEGIGAAATTAILASDRRLKSNITRVGTHPLGIGIYEYDIFGSRQQGVMADEVLSVRPEAVLVGADGFYRVDYSKL